MPSTVTVYLRARETHELLTFEQGQNLLHAVASLVIGQAFFLRHSAISRISGRTCLQLPQPRQFILKLLTQCWCEFVTNHDSSVSQNGRGWILSCGVGFAVEVTPHPGGAGCNQDHTLSSLSIGLHL